MTKTEYQTSITTNLTAAEALCADLRKLRGLQKLAKTIPDADKLVSLDLVGKTITDKETQLKKIRAELGKARRIVKHMEEIEAIENGTEEKSTPKKSTKATGKAAAPATAQESTDKEGKTAKTGKSSKTTKAEKTPTQGEAKAQPAT